MFSEINKISGVFEGEEVTHIEGDIDPVRDLKIIFDELRLKDVQYLDAHLEKMGRAIARTTDKTKKAG